MRNSQRGGATCKFPQTPPVSMFYYDISVMSQIQLPVYQYSVPGTILPGQLTYKQVSDRCNMLVLYYGTRTRSATTNYRLPTTATFYQLTVKLGHGHRSSIDCKTGTGSAVIQFGNSTTHQNHSTPGLASPLLY